MENIAELLKNAPQGLVLYSPLCGECKFDYVSEDGIINVTSIDTNKEFTFDKYGRYSYCTHGNMMLFPDEDCGYWFLDSGLYPSIIGKESCCGAIVKDLKTEKLYIVCKDKGYKGSDYFTKLCTPYSQLNCSSFEYKVFATVDEIVAFKGELNNNGLRYDYKSKEIVSFNDKYVAVDKKDGVSYVYKVISDKISYLNVKDPYNRESAIKYATYRDATIEEIQWFKNISKKYNDCYTNEYLYYKAITFEDGVPECLMFDKEAYKHNAYAQTHYSLVAELMAKHVHDTWMAQRIKDGWKYGEHRDDKKKTHPCIVPYEELPESEKEYDRQTSLETINFLREQGFKIVQDNED